MRSKQSVAVDSVVEGIRRQITAGRFQAGTTLPSEQLLASSYGVSRGTVRRAIEKLVNKGQITRERYSRPVVAKTGSAVVQGNEVHVWVSRPIADQQALILIKEISRNLRGASFRLVVREPSQFIGTVVTSDEREFLLNVLENRKVAGAIMERDSFSDNSDVMRQIIDKGKHLVFVDIPPPVGVHADFVGTTNVASARIAVEHLLDLGHGRICCIADIDDSQTIKDRIKGFWRAMRQAGIESLGNEIVSSKLPEQKKRDFTLSGPYSRFIHRSEYFADLACRAVDAVLSMEPRPTALFVCHDVMAFWVCALLHGQGLSIPEDISVVGFDWLANWDDSIRDILTTAGQDFEGFGLHSANLLLDRLSGEVPATPRHVLLNAPLVVRSSTTSDLMLPAMGSHPSQKAELPQ